MNRRLPRPSPTLATWFAAAALLAGCDLTAPDPVATTLVVTPGLVELDALGATLPLSVLVRDQAGSSLGAGRVSWDSEDPRVVEVTEGGRLRAVGPGQARVRARFGDAEGWATVEVEPRPARADGVDGGEQVARAGTTLPAPLRFRLADRLENPLVGVPVTFSSQDGGTASPARVVTGSDGSVTVAWTLGREPGLQSLVATAAGRTFHFVASATDVSGQVPFRIRVLPVGAVSDPVMEAVVGAVARWERVIEEKLSPVLARVPAGRCGQNAPALDTVVDDLLILLSEGILDGPGGSAALAGPCFIRQEGLLPLVGRITVDTEDVAALVALGLLGDILTHEIGHVLGVGTLWNLFGLLDSPSLPDASGADTHFRGAAAGAAFGSVGGAGYAGPRVPVENLQGAQGVRDVHWRQAVFGAELMSPFLTPGRANPLSRVTAGSLADLGYGVRLDAAEPYALPGTAAGDEAAAASPDRPPFEVRHLNRTTPLHVLDGEGRIVHLIPAFP
ncbi:MAG: hypothetical protein EA350_02355 [Gemmatimonadales bacterium]|nr:MAG: hypothetical protein EA350_02355 [Gemmatimonadales bacterium]